jgi:hypothetical protein
MSCSVVMPVHKFENIQERKRGILHTCQDKQSCQPPVLTKQDISVQSVANHDSALGIELDSVDASSVSEALKNQSATYFALIQSNIVLAGLPMLIGSLSRAYLSGALMDPAPGNCPSEVGYVLSSFVARN